VKKRKRKKRGRTTKLKFDKITGSFYKNIDNNDYFKLFNMICNSTKGVSKYKLAEEIFGKSDDDEVNHYRRIRISVMLHYIRTKFQIWFVIERRWSETRNISFVRLAITKEDLEHVKKIYERRIKYLKQHKRFVEFDIKNFEQYTQRLENLRNGILTTQPIRKSKREDLK